MTSLLDNPDGVFLVLVNDERQYSIWPAELPPPAGWRKAFGNDTRQSCLDYIDREWTDGPAPRSIAASAA